jgi:exodeoxyribonuclease V alpha subunit
LAGTPEVLRLRDGLLYLDRYWREEQQVADDLLKMLTARVTEANPAVARLFPPGFEEQREAAEIALSQGLTVLTGGPGTGKTTTVARLRWHCRRTGRVGGQSRLRIACWR